MNSQREAFEKVFPVPEGLIRIGNSYSMNVLLSDENEHQALVDSFHRYNGQWQGWQAATEQGVGEAGYSIEADLEETQKDLSIAEAKIEEYESFFTGEDGDNHGGDAKAIINDYLRTHLPKPTGGGVPDTECPECGSTDLRWHCGQQVATGVSDGNLRLNDVSTVFFLGCEVCSETIETKTGIEIAALLATQQPPEQQASFQYRVDPWLIECFGEQIARDQVERNHRFLEEALELVQSTGCTEAEANELVSYVYGREIGYPPQEVGGVMVTLAALCLAQDMDMHDAGEVELARIWTKVPQIREKQKAKPAMSPLPGVYPDRQPPEQE